jgi:hypothetical protein
MTWTPIVGRKFSAPDFDAYLRTLKFDAWRPAFVTVHNTSSPTRALYASWQKRSPPVTMEKWLQNLVGYYRDQQHWSAGPHWFVADDGIGVFTPPTHPGVHTPSWNAVSIGVETVGEFELEPFDGAVRDNLIASLASIHSVLGLHPEEFKLGVRGLHFHKEDVRTTHQSCPGHRMVKADLIVAVVAKMADMHPGEHVAERPVPATIVPGGMTGITATEFGGTGDPETSAYGGMVNPDAPEVSLPARVPSEQRRVRVFHGDKPVLCKVNDVGPWNKTDDYWNVHGARPLAETQHRNRILAQNGLIPSNQAGIDMTRAVFDALGIKGPEGTRQAVVDWEFA